MLDSGFHLAAKFCTALFIGVAVLGSLFAIGVVARLAVGDFIGAANLAVAAAVAIATLYAAVWTLLFVVGLCHWIVSRRTA